ncbi:hypothetical protein [Actinophytocola xanthii]|uniref:Uncharacterized protein n=1 Tax=Actinophytocola xanthii TaxID=1912961 RepID=A0A1Q8CS37_9PSEU|nr:hypothetical protein [Actinophytocola xanthii]OLF17150.1 hypothetical protein BU204_12905 [Actinophytocola xanthii]
MLLGVVTAAALTWSAGPARGRELVGWQAVPVAAGAAVVVVALEVLLYGEPFLLWLELAVMAVGALAACGRDSRVGRRAALVLVLPVMTALLADPLLYGENGPAPLGHARPGVVALVFYGVPVLVLLALGALPRRLGRREPVA